MAHSLGSEMGVLVITAKDELPKCPLGLTIDLVHDTMEHCAAEKQCGSRQWDITQWLKIRYQVTKGHRGTLKAYCEVKENNPKRLQWDNRNSILVSVLFLAQSSWNPCKFLSNKSIRGIFGASESSWMVPEWGLVIRNTKTWLEAQLVSAIPPSFRAGREVGNRVNNWSCLHEEASIKCQ